MDLNKNTCKVNKMTLEQTPDPMPERVPDDEAQPSAADRVRRVIEVARANLGPLLCELAGRVFEPEEADAAREFVTLVNHLSAILKTPLVFEGREVSLKCNIARGNARPVFGLRLLGGSEQTGVYGKKEFPRLVLEKTTLLD
jgi:hypothetical protein